MHLCARQFAIQLASQQVWKYKCKRKSKEEEEEEAKQQLQEEENKGSSNLKSFPERLAQLAFKVDLLDSLAFAVRRGDGTPFVCKLIFYLFDVLPRHEQILRAHTHMHTCKNVGRVCMRCARTCVQARVSVGDGGQERQAGFRRARSKAGGNTDLAGIARCMAPPAQAAEAVDRAGRCSSIARCTAAHTRSSRQSMATLPHCRAMRRRPCAQLCPAPCGRRPTVSQTLCCLCSTWAPLRCGSSFA